MTMTISMTMTMAISMTMGLRQCFTITKAKFFTT